MSRTGSLRLACLAVLIGFPGIGCSNQTGAPAPPPDTRAQEESTIRSYDLDFAKAAEARDLDMAVAHYMDDAVLFAPGAPAVVGKDNIRNYFKPLLSGPSLHFTFSDLNIDVARSGDLAEDRGSFEVTGTDRKGKPTIQKGLFVIVWKKQPDGAWKIAADTSANER